MRLVHGRLALTFRPSSCGGGDQALAWPDDPGEAASRRQALPRAAVQLASALRCLGLGVWWRRDTSQFTHRWWNSLGRLDCISRPNGGQSRNGIGLRPPGQAVREGWIHLAGLQVLWRRRRLHASDTGSQLALQRGGLCLPPLVPHGINRSKLVMHVRSLGAEVRVTAPATTQHGLGVLSQILVSTNRGAMPCAQEAMGASLAEPADDADEAVGEPLPSGLDGESLEAGMEEELPDSPSRGADSDEAANARTHVIPLWRKPIRVNGNWTTTSLCSRSVAAKTSLTCLPHNL